MNKQRMRDILLGRHRLTPPILLAPMSGVTDQPFRRLVRRFGVGWLTSEMIASREMMRAVSKKLRHLSDCAVEGPMSVQIAGTDPTTMADAARLNRDRGAAAIDLNFGCPAKKVTNKACGSAIMRDETLAGDILKAVAKAVEIPVTVKMRLGWNDASHNAARIARMAQDCGYAMVTVHGRTRCQFYTGSADWSAIRAVRNAITLPLIVNGDIKSASDARQALAASGADGVMVGRAVYGKPWLLALIAGELGWTAPYTPPSLSERLALTLDHYTMLLEHYGDYRGTRIARKHLGWAMAGLRDANRYRDEINTMTLPNQVRACLARAFAPEPPADLRAVERRQLAA
jgi:tRNA-dihydrouridine synthase B